MRIGSQEIQYLNAFQTISRANAKDCLVGANSISFVVSEGQMGKTIGKKGSTIKRLRQALQKNVELFEHKKSVESFLQNAFPEILFEGFEKKREGEKTVITAKINTENKKKIMNDAGKIKRVKELAKRNYGIDDFHIGK